MPGLPHDADLPELASAFDPRALGERFAERWARVAGAPVAIADVRRTDADYRPGERCTVTYALAGHVAGAARTTFGAVEVEPSGMRAWLAGEDERLPALRALLGAGPPAGVPGPGRWRARPVKYRPGRRCVVRFEPADGPAGPLFGKLFATGVEEQRATLEALASAAEDVRVVAPAGCWPELGLLVQPAVRPGTSLTAVGLAGTGAAAAWMREAGGAIGGLHGVRWRPPARATLAGDLDGLEGFRGVFAHLAPEQSGRFAETIDRLRAAAGAVDKSPVVTSHGALRTGQLLVDAGSRLAIVDLDTCCLAHPARDVANLLAYLDWHAVRHPGQRRAVESAASAFLDAYARAAPAPDARALRVFRAASLLKIGGRRLRRVEVEAWPHLADLLALAEAAAR